MWCRMNDHEMSTHIAQELRKMHCDRKDLPDHTCVGVMTVKPGGIDLDCKLCGKCALSPAGWDMDAAVTLATVFRAAGIEFDKLSIDAQIAAIKAAKTYGLTP